MDKAEFLVIFPTFESLDVVTKTLPSVIEETSRNPDARLIIHDTSFKDRGLKWGWLQEITKDNKQIMLLLSNNMSMAHSRNMCLLLGYEMFAPDYILMLEDDHGLKENAIKTLIYWMDLYYGKVSPNGLRYGMFSLCYKHTNAEFQIAGEGIHCPHESSDQLSIGGMNSCFRCAPTSHWQSVLKGYNTDEYLLSLYQTIGARLRNYHKGFTVMFIGDGKLCFDIERQGWGTTSDKQPIWDDNFCASDKRSKYRGKQ